MHDYIVKKNALTRYQISDRNWDGKIRKIYGRVNCVAVSATKTAENLYVEVGIPLICVWLFIGLGRSRNTDSCCFLNA